MPLMKSIPLSLVAAFFISTAVGAQTSNPPITPKLCEQQARVYVAEKNTHEPEPNHGRSSYWSFAASHYDSSGGICYVMYARYISEDPPDSRVYLFWESIRIDDVRETYSTLARFGDSCVLTADGHTECINPGRDECQVNGQTCETKAEFIELVHKWLPTFKPFKKQRPS